MEKKIAKLKLMPIFEGTAILEESGSKIQAISVGSSIEIRKADGASALFIDSVVTEPVRYNKIEEKDLEIETLQNELAGIVGQFDGQVHKLMAKYGYEWVNPEEATAAAPISTMESVNESGSGDPAGSWIGDFLVLKTISISDLVDEVVENEYDFSDEQDVENKFRSKVKELLMESGDLADALSDENVDMQDLMFGWVEDHESELTEFADYRTN